jgi:Phosphotransferase enzyme family
MEKLAVPTDLEAVSDPEWLGWALDIGDRDRVVAVEEVDQSKTLAQKVRLRVTVQSADGRQEIRPLCVKAHLDGSPGADLVPEALFYRDLAPRLGVRMPRAYYTGIDEVETNAMIIMDDVVALGGRFLDAHTPYPIDTARDTLGQLARFHAETWGMKSEFDWLTARVGSFGDMYPKELLQTLLDDGRATDIAPELRDAGNVVEAVKRTGQHPITCAIHGDTQSGNFYLDGEGRACLIDFQLAQLGNWSIDVGYHLGTILDVEERRRHEADLLRHYLDQLAAFGAPAPSWDDAWEQYTLSFSYAYFLWVITRISSRAIVLLHIPRLAAALTDHATFRRLGVV